MATAKEKSDSASQSGPPKGMKPIIGGFAATWQPSDIGATLHGTVSDAPKVVTLTQGKKTVERQCVEVVCEDKSRHTVWESAGLKPLFSALAEQVPCKVWIKYTGLGTAKKGQNAPKLFETAIG